MNKKVMLFLCLFICLLLSLETNNAYAANKKNNYIVITETKKSLEKVKSNFGDKKLYQENDFSELEKHNMTVINISSDELQVVENSKDIVCVESDYYVDACGKNKEKNKIINTSEWNMKIINSINYTNIDEGKKVNKKDKKDKVKVAILDLGIDEYAENINVVERINLIPHEEEVSTLFEDITGHGTSIASIICSNGENNSVKGIDSDIELYSAKVLDEKNTAPISRIIEGIYWAVEKNVNIISISFGTEYYSIALENAINYAYENGILVIAAAGNKGNCGVEYPAAYDNVMAIGAIDSEAEICDFSSTGDEIELVAPGDCVKTTGAFGGDLIASGTSIAVPHVVGVACVLWKKPEIIHTFMVFIEKV